MAARLRPANPGRARRSPAGVCALPRFPGRGSPLRAARPAVHSGWRQSLRGRRRASRPRLRPRLGGLPDVCAPALAGDRLVRGGRAGRSASPSGGARRRRSPCRGPALGRPTRAGPSGRFGSSAFALAAALVPASPPVCEPFRSPLRPVRIRRPLAVGWEGEIDQPAAVRRGAERGGRRDRGDGLDDRGARHAGRRPSRSRHLRRCPAPLPAPARRRPPDRRGRRAAGRWRRRAAGARSRRTGPGAPRCRRGRRGSSRSREGGRAGRASTRRVRRRRRAPSLPPRSASHDPLPSAAG